MSQFTRIIRDPEICGGDPVIAGTRVLVQDILTFLKEGKPFNVILESFPSITREDIREIISYAQTLIAGEEIFYGNQEVHVPS